MLGKLLNIAKKNKYYLELDEDNPVVEKAEEVAARVKVGVQQGAEQTVKDVKAVAEEVKENVENIVKEELAPEAKAKAKETTAKETANQTTASTKTQPSTETAQTVPDSFDTSYREEPFWVAQLYKSSEEKAAEAVQEKTFATDYLIEKPKARRRPGGSIDKFKSMARDTKVKF